MSRAYIQFRQFRLNGSLMKRSGLILGSLRNAQAQVQSYHTGFRDPYPHYRRPVMHCLSQGLAFNERVAARTIYTSSRPSRLVAGFSTSNIVVKVCAILGCCATATGIAILIFFMYDSSTYHGGLTAEDIPVAKSALEPRRGGPKNLPIADSLMGEYDSKEMVEQRDKPKLVILGTGWGSIALLKKLHPGDYHVTVVSPTNYFLFTPMLPSATMGTVGLRSLVEPVRRTVKRLHGHFLKATADDVLFSENLVEVSQAGTNGELQQFYIPYDKLVIAVGMFCAPLKVSLAKLLPRLRSKPTRRQRPRVLSLSKIN